MSVEPHQESLNGLTHGPVQKNMYSYMLEHLIKKMLADEKVSIKKNDKGETILCFTAETYNLTKVLKFANLSHVFFEADDFERYDKFVSAKTRIYNPHFRRGDNPSEPPDDPQFSHLHNAEKKAINLYTQGCTQTFGVFGKINQILRGTSRINKLDELREILFASVFCASGVSKIPTKPLHYKKAYRYEWKFDSKVHEERIQLATEKGLCMLNGFFSCSRSSAEIHHDGPVKWEVSNLRGSDIGALSYFPEEKEHLIPPTLVQITSHQIVGQRHIFQAKCLWNCALQASDGTICDDLNEDINTVITDIKTYLSKEINKLRGSNHIDCIVAVYGYTECLEKLNRQENASLSPSQLLKEKQNMISKTIEFIEASSSIYDFSARIFDIPIFGRILKILDAYIRDKNIKRLKDNICLNVINTTLDLEINYINPIKKSVSTETKNSALAVKQTKEEGSGINAPEVPILSGPRDEHAKSAQEKSAAEVEERKTATTRVIRFN